MSKILVLGANGMLGGSLFRYFSANTAHDVLGSVRSTFAADALSSQGFSNHVVGIDVTCDGTLRQLFDDFVPDFVFNCVGIIKQLDQSKAPIPSIQINSLLPHRLAALCDRINAKLVHFSTDCVFSGQAGLYIESDVPDSLDLYGRSKLLGEVNYGRHLTLRTSIIGHEMKSAVSLVDWFLSQSGKVSGYSRAVFSGLPTVYVAQFLDEYVLSNPEFSGLYHLSVDPIDKYSLLKLIKQVYHVETEISEFTDFEINRSLDSTKLRDAVGFCPEGWPLLMEKMYNEYQRYFC